MKNEILLWLSIWILCIYCVLRDCEEDLEGMKLWQVLVRIVMSPIIVVFQIAEWIWIIIIRIKNH